MKKILISLCLLLAITTTYGQNPNPNRQVFSYYFNGTPVNGIKIKTNMPFTDGTQMPTLIFEGYNYGGQSPIGLLLTYYVYAGAFTNSGVSSFGAYVPPITMANEGGKVVIFINSKDYFVRFNLRAYAQARTADDVDANYQGWTIVDEALSGSATAQLQLPYRNRMAGDVFLQGGIWNSAGNVGVGITAPQAGLHVAKVNVLADGTRAAAILGNTYNDWTIFGGLTGAKIRGSNEGYLDIETNATGTDKNLYMNISSSGNIIMANGGGNVGIGTGNPQAKLAVNGDVFAKRVKVTQTGWPDYVFAPDYTLHSLAEIEKYVKVNRHLPGIPAAAEVEKEGLDVGEMNKKLLEKVEELTLYLIEQQKEIKELKEEVKQLKGE